MTWSSFWSSSARSASGRKFALALMYSAARSISRLIRSRSSTNLRRLMCWSLIDRRYLVASIEDNLSCANKMSMTKVNQLCNRLGDEAIREAQERIQGFKDGIRVYRAAKRRGDLWPGEKTASSATPLKDTTQ